MRKIDEIERQDSCWNKAHQGERVFILLDRDVASPDTIRFWCAERIRKGKNTWSDPQIKEALALAESIEAEHRTKAERAAEAAKRVAAPAANEPAGDKVQFQDEDGTTGQATVSEMLATQEEMQSGGDKPSEGEVSTTSAGDDLVTDLDDGMEADKGISSNGAQAE